AVSDFLTRSADALTRGEGMENGWGQAVLRLPLHTEEQTAMAELGKALQGMEENACKAITLAIHILEARRGAEAAAEPDRERRALALTVSAAALLVILLI
ncbi:MAG: hypothetical protein IKN53_01800, partial [Oscillibacter sp.]|nr:hypothetical protein [Oscillibacter sp.]